MGSGTILKRAIKKHGLENFVKKILHVYDTAEEMFAKEKELVYVSEETYNIKNGGLGGWDHMSDKKPFLGKRHSDETRRKMSEATKKHQEQNPHHRPKGGFLTWREETKQKWKDKSPWSHPCSEESNQKRRDKMKGRVPWNKGIPRTQEEKAKIRDGVVKSKKRER
jgi:hypothetical protein